MRKRGWFTPEPEAMEASLFELAQIQIRDPFVLPVEAEQSYYLFGTTDPAPWGRTGRGFDAYRSTDLQRWVGPFPAFRPDANFWGTHHFWAPEVHLHDGRYYLFASFKADGVPRGTQILVADRPEGPYRPHSDGPVTPAAWECLDGTLYIADDGQPWMVFCHEWIQITDGTLCAIRLRRDFGASEGETVVLFKGSEAPWSEGLPEAPDRRVTDGPFLHRTAAGGLIMLWSTIGAEGYTMGYAESESGDILGPWKQHPEPLFRRDGGHGMIFRTFRGDLLLALHHPNETPLERAKFLLLNESPDGRLELAPNDTLR